MSVWLFCYRNLRYIRFCCKSVKIQAFLLVLSIEDHNKVLIDGDPIEVQREELVIGEPVPWRLFDREQRLLVREGTTITSERQVDALMMRGAIRFEVVDRNRPRRAMKKPVKEHLGPRIADTFRDYHRLAEELMSLFYRYEDDPDSLAELIEPLQHLAAQCRGLVRQDPDKALVALQLMHEYPYIVIHPIHVAIIVMIMEMHFRSSEAHQQSVVCAALTQNLSMNNLQEELFTQLFPLDQEQRAQLERHPLETVEQLMQAGVNDALWLDIIRQHHEKPDGRGYPRGLREEEILTESTVICLADRYSAMLFDRPFRETREPRNILKGYLDESKKYNSNLPLIFIKQMGVYPPGLFVRLNSGETAMVVKRTGPNEKPMVVSYINPRGVSYDPPVLRDTGAGRHYGIKAVCKVDPEFFDLDKVWAVVTSLQAPI